MKILIWGDIHLRIDLLEQFLAKNKDKYDGWVFLGDYFDQFGDTAEQNKQAAIFIKEILFKLPNLTLILGNHDLPNKYGCNQITYCPGYSDLKFKLINSVFNSDDWAKFKDYTIIDGWLISHAGFAPSIYNHPINGFNIEYLNEQLELGYKSLAARQFHPIFSVGYARGGRQPFGGHLWNDFHSEFIPLPNFKQIVGHSICKEPDCKYLIGDEKMKMEVFGPHIDQTIPSLSVCLDTNNRFFGELTDGYLNVHFTDEYI